MKRPTIGPVGQLEYQASQDWIDGDREPAEELIRELVHEHYPLLAQVREMPPETAKQKRYCDAWEEYEWKCELVDDDKAMDDTMRKHNFDPKTQTKQFKDIVTGEHSSTRRAKRRRELMQKVAEASGIPSAFYGRKNS